MQDGLIVSASVPYKAFPFVSYVFEHPYEKQIYRQGRLIRKN